MVPQKGAHHANDFPRLLRSLGQKRGAGQGDGSKMKDKKIPKEEEASSWWQKFRYLGSNKFVIFVNIYETWGVSR